MLTKIKISINIPINKIENKWVYLSTAAFGTLILSIYLFAFWPGLMSPDSVTQWDQLSNFEFTDAHPALHTLTYWLITRIYYSPASISIFQIISLILIWLYGIKSILKNLKVSTLGKIIILIISVIFFALPPIGLMSITLWKDTLFSHSLLLLTICLFNIAFDNNWINKKNNQSLLIITLACTALIRHNGLAIYAPTSLLLPIFFFKNKKFLKTTFLSLIIIILVKGPIYQKLDIKRSEYSTGIFTFHYLNSYLSDDHSFEKQNSKYIKNFFIDTTKNIYNPSCLNYLSNNIRTDLLKAENRNLNKLLVEQITINPSLFFKEAKKTTSLIWQIKQPASGYTYTHAIDDYEMRSLMKEKYNIKFFDPNSKLSFFIRRLVYLTESQKYKSLFWRPALNLIIVFFMSLCVLKKHKKEISIIYIIPITTLSLGLLLTIPGQDYRYLYANILINFYAIMMVSGNQKLKK